MNDVMAAAQGTEEQSTEAQDFVEMGSVSKDTKGGMFGDYYDGQFGWWVG